MTKISVNKLNEFCYTFIPAISFQSSSPLVYNRTKWRVAERQKFIGVREQWFRCDWFFHNVRRVIHYFKAILMKKTPISSRPSSFSTSFSHVNKSRNVTAKVSETYFFILNILNLYRSTCLSTTSKKWEVSPFSFTAQSIAFLWNMLK